MKLLVLALVLVSSQGQQGPPREVKWDYSEWQPILTPCSTCRQARILQAKPSHISTRPIIQSSAPIQRDTSSVLQLEPVIQTKLSKDAKPPLTKVALVPSQPPRTLAITFPPTERPKRPTTPAETSIRGGEVHLVFLPEGSIQQLSSANAARIIPTSEEAPQILQGIETVPPPLAPQAIQSIDFSDKQKRDHEGRIVPGGATNTLPMSLITTQGHEDDAREKLKLLEAALVSPIEQEEGKLPRVFIAPSHVPPPPGYVKIPLVPQRKPGAQGIEDNSPLPPTFLTPDSRNPPPGFIKFDLPSAVSQLSRDIPVVVPNSQVEPNFIFNGPNFFPTPGPIRPDAALNFQTQNVRTGKNIASHPPAVQVISKGESKSTLPPKLPAPSKQAVTKPSPRPTVQPSLQTSFRPVPQRTTPANSQFNVQTNFFPPRQALPLPQQFLTNPNPPRPFAPRPGQPAFPAFPGQSFPQPGQPTPQPGQPFPRPGHPIPQPGQSVLQAGQPFLQQNRPPPRPGQQFIQQNQPFQRPGQVFQRPAPPFSQHGQHIRQHNQPFLQSSQPFSQHGQTFLQAGQSFPRPIHPFPQPSQPFPQPGQRPVGANPNQSIFRSPHAQAQPDFPNINRPHSSRPQNPRPQATDFSVSRPTTPEPPRTSPFPSSSLTPETTPQTFTKSVVQFSPRPQLITQFTPKQFSPSSPRPIPSPSPFPVTQNPRFPPRPVTPESFSTPSPFSLIPHSSPDLFSLTPTPQLTTRPVPVSPTTQPSPRPTFTSSTRPIFSSSPRPILSSSPRPILSSSPRPILSSSPRPILSSSPRPILTSSPRPILSSTPRPQPLSFTPQPPVEITSPFAATPRPPFQQTLDFEDSSTRPRLSFNQENLQQQISEVQEPQIPSFQEPQIPSFQDPQAPQIPAFQEPQHQQIPSIEEPTALQIPSFQRPQTTTVTRFPGPQSPRIPSFQRPSTTRTPFNENSQEVQEPGKRQRLPIFPRFQRPRITTIAPDDEEQTLLPEFTTPELLTSAPTTPSPTTPFPSTTSTVKVTTFKPKFNFNLGNRRPIIRRKPRPTETIKKDVGEKKNEVVTLFPPFSVARTLNPLRNDNKENEGNLSSGQSGITVPPAGAFGRRLRPRTKAPIARSDDDSHSASPRPSGLRARGPIGNRARELPEWLKARRRVRGRFRGPTTITENVRVVDSVLEDDIPLDILENNEFSGAESTLVVFSSPPENAVANIQEAEKALEKEVEEIIQEEYNQEFSKVSNVAEEQTIIYDAEVAQEEAIPEYDNIASSEELDTSSSSASSEVLPKPHDPVALYEDYSFEKTEVLPEPEPESSNKYVAEYDKYEDDIEDTPETYHTPDQSHRQPPSFSNPQPIQHITIHTSAHSHPFVKAPMNPLIENFKTNHVETAVDYLVDEIDDATERYVGNENSDESELVTNLPLDKETDAQLPNDTEVNVKNNFESVTKRTNLSYEDNNSEVNSKIHQLGGGGEEDAEWENDGESQEHGEDSYQEYSTESPEILSLFPNDYFTALSPGELQDYDYYEYDSYVDEDYTEGMDQDFGGSSAQVVFAVPVTEYYPEETTLIQEHFQMIEEERLRNNELASNINPTTEELTFTTTEEFGLGIENEYITTELPLIEDDESATESLLELNEVTIDYDITTQIPEEEEVSTTYVPSDSFSSTTTTAAPSTTTPVTSTTTSPTTARPSSIRPLYARLQSAGKKAAEISDKKLARMPKILGQSTVTEIRSSDPIICFQDNQCVRARGQRRRRNNKP